MKNKISVILTALLICLFPVALRAQQKTSALTGVNWAPVTGHGAPTTASCAHTCTAADYGLPYTDLDANTTYIYTGTGTVSGWNALGGGGGGSVASSANIYAGNSQVQADSLASSTANGMVNFGDSITAGVGCSTAPLCYVPQITSDYGVADNNQGVPGDRSGDMAFHIFTVLNPGDSGNPIVTGMIGTNDDFSGAPANVLTYLKQVYAGVAWGGLSTTYKMVTSNAAVTKTGSWTTNSTFANAIGETSSTAGNTLAYTCQVGPSGTVYVWYRLNASDGTWNMKIDGTTVTDTVSNSSTISGTWAYAPAVATSSVGLARFTATQGSHTCTTTVVSGTVSILSFGMPSLIRNRGMSAPRFFLGGVVPQLNNANQTNQLLYNSAALAVSKRLTADGNYVPFVDSATLDPVLDFSAAGNCPAAVQQGLHPNNCGHRQLANLFESLINSMPTSTALATPPPTLPGLTGGGNVGTYSPTGSTFNPGGICVGAPSGFGQCLIGNGTGGGPYKTILTGVGNSSGAFGTIGFSFVPANATPTQVDTGIFAQWSTDGSATLNPGFTIGSTASGRKMSFALPINTPNVLAYTSILAPSASTTTLMNGFNMNPGTGSAAGLHFLFHNGPGAYGPGIYFQSGQIDCLADTYTTSPNLTTTSAAFTCLSYVDFTGILHSQGLVSPSATLTGSTPAAPLSSILTGTNVPSSLATAYQLATSTNASTTAILNALNIEQGTTGGVAGGLIFGNGTPLSSFTLGLFATYPQPLSDCWYDPTVPQASVTNMSQVTCPIYRTFNASDPGTLHVPQIQVTGPTPTTVLPGAMGIGNTTAAASNCNSGGVVTGVAGCLEQNIGGVIRYIPYY